jgi:suppressor of ftsI
MMAGALIIADRPGNFPHELAQMDDLVMVLQAICLEKCHTKFDDLVEALTIFYSKKKDTHYRQISTEFPVDLEIEDTGSPLNDTSLLHVYVNGQYQPEIHMKPNEFKRFRYINAIANNLVEIIVPKCEMFLLGMDGIYRKHPIQKEIIVLAPGGRMDVAIKCPHEGAYFVETQADPKRNHLLGQKHRVSSQKIISLRVIGGVLAQEQMVLPRELPQRPLYMTDLLDVKKISRHYDYEFSVWTFANRSMEFGVNQMPFDKSFVNHTLKMDEPEEWTLSTKMYGHCIHTMDQLGTSSIDTGSESADQSSSSSSSHCHHMNHPFHIHGTHYQITNKMLDFDPDNILYELGEWRDTIPLYDTHVRIRFTPRRHMLGNIMTHCHVASHADAGMAQLVQVVQ